MYHLRWLLAPDWGAVLALFVGPSETTPMRSSLGWQGAIIAAGPRGAARGCSRAPGERRQSNKVQVRINPTRCLVSEPAVQGTINFVQTNVDEAAQGTRVAQTMENAPYTLSTNRHAAQSPQWPGAKQDGPMNRPRGGRSK